MSLPVCAACGVLAPDDRALCTFCAAPFPDPRPVAPEPEGDRRWVCVRTRFRCNACAQTSPVREFSDDDILECLRCGQRQGFPESELRDVLEIAHATVDPGLRDFDVFDQLGGKATLINYARDKLSILAAPGHPRCARCRAFARLLRADGETCEVSCECGPQRHHVPRVLARHLDELRGVVSDETRLDVPRAKGLEGSALACAHCGAALDADAIGRGSIVECSFCKAATRVEVPSGPKADPLWLLVEGTSKKRREHQRAETNEKTPPPKMPGVPKGIARLARSGLDDETYSTLSSLLIQGGVVAAMGLIYCPIFGWDEVSGYSQYRARAAMVETTCTVERISDEQKGKNTLRTHHGKALFPSTETWRAVVTDPDEGRPLDAFGAGKSSTEEVITPTRGVGFPITIKCFLDEARGHVVFNRPVGFSVLPLTLLSLGFAAALALAVWMGKKLFF